MRAFHRGGSDCNIQFGIDVSKQDAADIDMESCALSAKECGRCYRTLPAIQLQFEANFLIEPRESTSQAGFIYSI